MGAARRLKKKYSPKKSLPHQSKVGNRQNKKTASVTSETASFLSVEVFLFSVSN